MITLRARAAQYPPGHKPTAARPGEERAARAEARQTPKARTTLRQFAGVKKWKPQR